MKLRRGAPPAKSQFTDLLDMSQAMSLKRGVWSPGRDR